MNQIPGNAMPFIGIVLPLSTVLCILYHHFQIVCYIGNAKNAKVLYEHVSLACFLSV